MNPKLLFHPPPLRQPVWAVAPETGDHFRHSVPAPYPYHRWASFPQKPMVTSFPFLAKYKIETVTSFSLPAQKNNKSFFLLQSLVKVSVNRSRYSIELNNGTVKLFPLLVFLKKERLHRSRYYAIKKWNVYLVLVTNEKLNHLHHSRYCTLQKKVIDLKKNPDPLQNSRDRAVTLCGSGSNTGNEQ
jgi:hypothetical protein